MLINIYSEDLLDNTYRDRNRILPISYSRRLEFSTKGSFIRGGENDQARLRKFQPMREEQYVNFSGVKTQKITSVQEYTIREAIFINNNEDLNDSFPGTGTINDPIRIENYSIIPESGVPLVYISDTTLYFRIAHNFLNSTMFALQGIMLQNVQNGFIFNNTISNNRENGIDLINSSNNILVNNTIFNNQGWSGIWLNSSRNNVLTNNTVNNNNGHGIQLSFSENNSVFNNTAYSNIWAGISLTDSVNNSISQNKLFSNNWTGLILEDSNRNNLTKNSLYNHINGIQLWESSNNSIINNTVRYTNRTTLVKIGILLSDSRHNFIINNSLTNTGFVLGGTNIESFEQKTVVNNSVNAKPLVYWEDKNGGTVPQGAGQIILFNCTNVLITGQTLSQNSIGVLTIYCSHLTICNNIVHDSMWGIFVHNTNKTTLTNNTGYNNVGNIHLKFAFDNIIRNNGVGNNSNNGIMLYFSENTTISKNTICNTNLRGIYLQGAENNTIAQNIIFDNIKHGILADELSKDNFVQFNDFNGNIAGGSQVADNGTNNIFEYNYWSDWIGTGTYPIDGMAENQDSSPLTNPYHLSVSIITSPTYDTLMLSDNVTIHWTPSLDTFNHYLNYTLFYSINEGGSWIVLSSGLTTTNYTLDTTTITNGTLISLKIHTIDSVGFVSKTVSTETFHIANTHQLSSPSSGFKGVENPNFLPIQVILASILVISSIATGYYLVTTKFRTPSFSEYFQSDKIEFLKPIYHKVIIGLESIQTAIISETVVTPLLEEPTMPTSLITWFPDDYRIELKTKLKGRTILTLIEIVFQYSEDANLTKLAQALDIPVSTLSDELKKLIKLNYLDFHVTPQVLYDGRKRHYIITAKGISFLKIMKSALELSIRRAKEKKYNV